MILGIDEVGRGAWAGPLVVGAVVLGSNNIDGLTDSKLLTKKRRDMLNDEICEKALGVGLGWVWPEEIDDIGLGQALCLATRRAVSDVNCSYHEIIIDGTVNFLAGTSLGPYVTTMKKADLLISSVSAASIVAKVARDRYMSQRDDLYTGYKFASHVGYGTAAHRSAIEKLGVTPLHRLSIAPLQKYKPALGDEKSTSKIKITQKTTRQIGDNSETAAALALKETGHEIVERNWKTKWCEIDIITKKEQCIYFVEVKHRKNDSAGDGLEAITPKKLQQMKHAAELYVLKNKLQNLDRGLIAVATTGDKPIVTEILHIS